MKKNFLLICLTIVFLGCQKESNYLSHDSYKELNEVAIKTGIGSPNPNNMGDCVHDYNKKVLGIMKKYSTAGNVINQSKYSEYVQELAKASRQYVTCLTKIPVVLYNDSTSETSPPNPSYPTLTPEIKIMYDSLSCLNIFKFLYHDNDLNKLYTIINNVYADLGGRIYYNMEPIDLYSRFKAEAVNLNMEYLFLFNYSLRPFIVQGFLMSVSTHFRIPYGIQKIIYKDL